MLTNNSKLSGKDRLIVALDVPTLDQARRLIEELREHVGMFKAGLELFTSCGVELFELAGEMEVKLFFDGKFHDIPNTVAGACRAAVRHGVDMFNIHALGGREMMQAAALATKEESEKLRLPAKPALIAVTVLTSTAQSALEKDLKVSLPMNAMVTHLASLAKECGLDGVVASAHEAPVIREALGDDFLIVTPGIRPQSAAKDDQERVVTPGDAIARGANYIVVGRPIVKAGSPVDAARRIVEELEAVSV